MRGGEAVLAGHPFDAQGSGGGSLNPTLFVCDPTAEAEQVAITLRAGGYTVVDVPLSMLVARAAVQFPRVVLVDADSQGVLEVIGRMRELPQGEDIHVVFLATPGSAASSVEEALAHEGTGFFSRPVDLRSLVQTVEALAGPPRREEREAASPDASSTQAKLPSTVPPPTLSNTGPPPSGQTVGQPGIPPAPPSLPPTSIAWAEASRAVGLGPPVSPDLQRLLAEAEERVNLGGEARETMSPEQEVEAVLPRELLASLDEPLEDNERDPESPGTLRPPSRGAAEGTVAGTSIKTTGASGTGTGATPHGTGVTGTGDEGLTPSPAGPTVAPQKVPEVPLPRPAVLRVDTSAFANEFARELGAMRIVAATVAERRSGCLCFASPEAERRIVVREGDVVTCASTAEEESLLAFLGVRGDLPRETVRRLGARFPAFGKHAGAALVARGYLRQDQMWATLRAHSEWVLARLFQAHEARAVFEAQPPGRLAGEPNVFGGATGAEVFVEAVRRTVAPSAALEQLGGPAAHLASGDAPNLLQECGLPTEEARVLRSAPGCTVRDVLEACVDEDFASALLASTLLGVLAVVPTIPAAAASDSAEGADVAALDSDAIRERVRARMQLVEDGDYFSILGVGRDATGYEVRRAFLELRRAFDPARLLSSDVADLADDVQTVTSVLEEAYDVLKDPARRERYRRAIEGVPQA